MASLLGVALNWAMLWQLWRLFEAYRQQRYFAAASGRYLYRLGCLILLAVPLFVLLGEVDILARGQLGADKFRAISHHHDAFSNAGVPDSG